MRILVVGLFALGSIGLGGGCGGSTGIMGGDDDDPIDPTPPTLTFASPQPMARFVRDHLEPTDGWRATTVVVDLDVGGDAAQVVTIDLAANDLALGTTDDDGRADVVLIDPGVTTLTATGRDAAGQPVATASIDVEVVEPQVGGCKQWLELYGVTFSAGPARDGVPDPVTVTTPINGMPYRYLGNANQRATFFMDCGLARSLVDAAPFMRRRGVAEVIDIGVYNYRCIGSGTPPNCPQGFSQHAYAKAIDLHEFKTTDGKTYNVEDDWIIDPAAEPTCAAVTAGDKDTWLHELICELKGDDVWNIVLTPNYNSAHRNHFHVDLTAGSDFIRKWAPRPVSSVDEGPDGH